MVYLFSPNGLQFSKKKKPKKNQPLNINKQICLSLKWILPSLKASYTNIWNNKAFVEKKKYPSLKV